MTRYIGNVEKFWLGEEHPPCYRKNNLVYIGILKNASTFYEKLFVSNDWELVSFNDINWDNDKIFGFIQDPVNRYLKGLVEDLYSDLELQKNILPLLEKHQQNILPITFHTLPISLTCGDHMYNVTWFPLDVEVSSTQQVIEFCSTNGVNLVWNGPSRLHTSNPGKLEFFNRLKSLMSNGNTNLWKMLSRDIDLYHRVVTKI